jgi:D-alanyl-D-alanine carboxypeptidase (penicillin-binding protein 5/6)
MSVLQQGRRSRAAERAAARRARRRHWALVTILAAVLAVIAVLALMSSRVSDRSVQPQAAPTKHTSQPSRSSYGAVPAAHQVHVNFKAPPRSGLLFDVRTGRVLWARDPQRVLPIASLTKMMTALVVAAHGHLQDNVLITKQAVHYSGSGIGLLPLGKPVPLMALLYGLLLPSGNDAAIALAQHVAGTQARFVELMNSRAAQMGLRCTHFTSPSGIVDRGNHSCARDLAVLAHAMLERPVLARIVATRSAILPFPIKGGKLYLYNNNPLMYLGYRGIDGVKTGYTVAAGPCLVATARRGRAWYGVVLLHSVNPPTQGQKLLDAAFTTSPHRAG